MEGWILQYKNSGIPHEGAGMELVSSSTPVPHWAGTYTSLISFHSLHEAYYCPLHLSQRRKLRFKRGDISGVTQLIRQRGIQTQISLFLSVLMPDFMPFLPLPITWGPRLSYLTPLPLTFSVCEVGCHAGLECEIHTRCMHSFKALRTVAS